MSKLHEIEKKLISINDAVFQNVCDAYLYFTEREYPDLHRTGSQKGKQKTVKGTPDTFFKLTNGRYVLVEYTTKEKKDNKSAFITKIKEDIDKCLNEKLTGIKLSSVQKIIFCHNSSLTLKESNTLIEYCQKKKVKLEFKDTHSIAMGLFARCPNIAKEFLGIQIDTAQILPLKTFTEEYAASGIATPLNNKFHFREDELHSLVSSIKNNLITVLTGAPGVGKSRLALAALEGFKKDKNKYTTYCISNKNTAIYDDLRVYLKTDKNYILLIDDANRQLQHFLSLLAILSEKRKGTIKIVLTVRDYALETLYEKCGDYTPNVISIKKLTDVQLTEILKSDDFKILNPEYHKRILEIADGNPRLAIMAAKVAKEKNTLLALLDVSDLYDKYFSLSISDTRVFSDKKLLKTLGLISFFYSVDRNQKDFMDVLLKQFKLDYYDFNEAIDKLEKLELLETSVDLSVVKISEQVLSTYFFYKSFLKDKELDFSLILTHYFDSHYSRIKDTVIPANNTFGYDNVYKQINPFLNKFWETIKSNENIAIKFLELFWFYRSNDVFSFVYEKIETQPLLTKTSFTYNDDKANKTFDHNSDKYLNLLSSYLFYPSNEFVPAIELSFEYVKKNPESYTQFVKFLSHNLLFSHEDYKNGFYRQVEFIKHLTSNIRQKIYLAAFFDVLPTLMKTNYNITSSGRNRNTINWYHYDIPLNNPIKEFRKMVWGILQKSFKKYSAQSVEFLYKYLERSPDKVKEVYTYDTDFLINLIDTSFSTKEFEHCYIVQDLIRWYSRAGIKHNRLNELKLKYTNAQYNNYLILSYNRLRDKEEFEFDNWDEYRRLKEEEISKAYTCKGISEFKTVYKDYLLIYNWKYGQLSDMQSSLEAITLSNYNKNNSLGIEILKEIVKQGNHSNYVPWSVLHALFLQKNGKHIADLYNFIIKNEFSSKTSWLLNFYRLLPDDLVEKKQVKDLLNVFKNATHSIGYIDTFSYINKFSKFDSNLPIKLLQTIIDKNKQGEFRLVLEHDFYKQHIAMFKKHFELLRISYFQQDDLNNHFDHNCEGFLELVTNDSNFLKQYLQHICKNKSSLNTREYQNLSIVWKLPNAPEMIKTALDILVEKSVYSFKEHFANVLFEKLDEENTKKAIKILKELLKKWKSNISGIKMVFDIIRHSFKDYLSDFVKVFLSHNQTLEIFKKIDWADTSFIGNGDTIFADIQMKQYEEVLNIVNSIQKQAYKFAKHKSYLQEMIDYEKRQADWERKRKFMDDRW